MATREINLELLLGKQVVDLTGKTIGRIEEVRAEKQGDEWVVQAYLIGTIGVLERLSAWNIAVGLLHLMGAHKIHGGYTIPWDKLDLTNPKKPHLLCSIDELKNFNNPQSQR
ncbi:hypothetical protein [Fischerella sp. JS2]|uniref:hypothetical protein n=1 Tax=Fischerella sp. JS2 TaxID=2597771 RepID=UPI0028E6C35E|nr:hypothetical protein [Fischerella sp. JS2]